MRKLFALLFLCALVHPHSWAGTINAASASQSDVQTAVNSASDGDTVQVPVGAATWNSGVSWTDKNITLAGTSSCTGITPGCAPVTTTSNSGTATVITCNVSPCITVNLNTKSFRITGFWFNRAVSSGIIIQISQGSTFLDTKVNGIRIDHNFFDDHLQGSGNDVAMNGYTYGLQDHNTFFVILGDQSTLLTENGVGESDANINALSGSKSWARANTLGTADAWYFEDNIFSVGDATGKTWFNPIVGDGTAGNVFVVRHNYFCGGAVETHGAYSRGSRGTKQWEVYENDFYPFFWDCSTNASLIANGYQYDGIKLRGGTGVIFNNRFHGGTWDSSGGPIYFDVERAIDANAHTPINTRCSGAVAYDGNSNPGTTYGWPCLDQVGRGFGAATPSGPFTETSLPVLEWGNVKCTGLACTSPVATHPVIDPNSGTRPFQSDVLQNNRDWCQVAPGTCSGTSCSTTCNGVSESYTAYTYPFPLPSAVLTYVPNPLTFNPQQISTTSSGQTITITNTSGSTITLTSEALQTGTNYSISSNTCGGSLTAFAACVVTITFTPLSTNTLTDNLVVTSSDIGSPVSVPLSGVGLATPVIIPATGSYSGAQTTTITDSTTSTSIYYTLDGTAPDNTKTLYSGSFLVSTTTTVRAVAYLSGVASGSTTSVITITGTNNNLTTTVNHVKISHAVVN